MGDYSYAAWLGQIIEAVENAIRLNPRVDIQRLEVGRLPDQLTDNAEHWQTNPITTIRTTFRRDPLCPMGPIEVRYNPEIGSKCRVFFADGFSLDIEVHPN